MFKKKTTKEKINDLKLDKVELEKQIEILWCFLAINSVTKYQERILYSERKLARVNESIRQLEIQLIEENRTYYNNV